MGTYADDAENVKLLKTVAHHLAPDGYALVSVMNLTATLARAEQLFSMSEDPDKLLQLQPSNTMQATGDIFDPRYMLVDTDTNVVYWKEQFSGNGGLPVELIGRDRRYTKKSLAILLKRAGLQVVWSRYVRAGAWDKDLDEDEGKEVLALCRKV